MGNDSLAIAIQAVVDFVMQIMKILQDIVSCVQQMTS